MSTKDIYDYQLGDDVSSRIQAASDALSSEEYQLGRPVTRKHPHRLMRLPRTWEDKLLIRHVNRKLRLALKVALPNRHTITAQIAKLLQSDAPLRIIRTDIRKFFDSVDVEETLQSILISGYLRQREEDVLQSVHNEWGHVSKKGLPWGIPLSSTFAELALRDFDHTVVRIPGVLYFRRFVDDIIIIAPAKAEISLKQLEEALPSGLKFSPDKTDDIVESTSTNNKCQNVFDYLGYHFERTLLKRKNSYTPQVEISISERKIERLAKRIELVAHEFRKERSLRNLTGRIRMLTGNYLISKAGHPKPIPVGIYFNYPMINNFEGLDRLDRALHRQLIALRIYIRQHGYPTSRVRPLMKYSFRIGHNRRIKHRFSVADLQQFRAAWAYD